MEIRPGIELANLTDVGCERKITRTISATPSRKLTTNFGGKAGSLW